MPTQSPTPQRVAKIDAINASLHGVTQLRYDATDTAIAAAEAQAFEHRVHQLAYKLAGDGERRAPTQAEIKEQMPIARLRLQAKEKRGGLGALVAGIMGRRESAEIQIARIQAEEQAAIQISAQYESFLERRTVLADRVALASSYFDTIARRAREIFDGLPDFVLIGAEQSSPGNPLKPIWDTYESLQSAQFALLDRDRVIANLSQRLTKLDAEIAVFKKEHGL